LFGLASHRAWLSELERPINFIRLAGGVAGVWLDGRPWRALRSVEVEVEVEFELRPVDQ